MTATRGRRMLPSEQAAWQPPHSAGVEVTNMVLPASLFWRATRLVVVVVLVSGSSTVRIVLSTPQPGCDGFLEEAGVSGLRAALVEK